MEIFFALLALRAGKSPVTGEFPSQRPETRSFDKMIYLICDWTNDWVNNRYAGDLRRHRTHYDVIVMSVYRKREYKGIKHYLNIRQMKHKIWICYLILRCMYIHMYKPNLILIHFAVSDFPHIAQRCYSGTRTTAWLPYCQWSNPGGSG